ncbi:MAG: carboxypeptidase-like regulatory domain-containing protein [Acidobacteriia bacterium]|nr:carboxypeptidase-like regulatory domain-containing protein [Terriglobia bacterium]
MSELLNNIRIASPCSADWEKMIGDDRVRHCGQCNLNVYNLSAMSSTEAQALVTKHEGRLCVRFYHRRDGTVLTRNCPVGLKVVMRRVSRIAGIALSAAMSASPLLAQTGENTPALMVQADTGLEVHVVDRYGVACPGASVELTNESNQSVVKAITNSDGIVRLMNLAPGSHTLTVTAPGLQPFHQTVWVREHVTFKLEISKDPPLIETTNNMVGVTGGAVVLTEAPLIDNRASAVMNTFSNTVLTTGGAIITEASPIEVAPPKEEQPPHRGFLRRAFSKLIHPWR